MDGYSVAVSVEYGDGYKRTDTRELIRGKREERLKIAPSRIWLVRGYGRRADMNDITTHAKKVATVRFLSAVRVGFLKNSILSLIDTNNDGHVK